MKIMRELVPQMTIEEFADAHGLTMEIHERELPEGDPSRFYAHFSGVEVMRGGFLEGAFGNGATEAEAIANYGRRISTCRLVVDAYRDARREIAPHRIVEDRR